MTKRPRTPATLVKRIYLSQGERLTTNVIPQEVETALLCEINRDNRANPLTAKQREALKLHFFDRLTLQEAGTQLEISGSAVWAREQRAIRRLKTSEGEVEAFRDILWDHNLVSSPLSVIPPVRGRPRKQSDSI